LQPGIAKKIPPKPDIFGFQGPSRSSMFIPPESSSTLRLSATVFMLDELIAVK